MRRVGLNLSVDPAQASPISPPKSSSRIEIPNLFSVAEWQHQLPWKPFRPGVEIHRLYGDGVSGPTAAFLRFSEGGVIPLHEHSGYEHIIVLSGEQRDDTTVSETGTLFISQPGSQHRVVSEGGCIVLAIYEKPVRFVEESAD